MSEELMEQLRQALIKADKESGLAATQGPDGRAAPIP